MRYRHLATVALHQADYVTGSLASDDGSASPLVSCEPPVKNHRPRLIVILHHGDSIFKGFLICLLLRFPAAHFRIRVEKITVS